MAAEILSCLSRLSFLLLLGSGRAVTPAPMVQSWTVLQSKVPLAKLLSAKHGSEGAYRCHLIDLVPAYGHINNRHRSVDGNTHPRKGFSV